MVAAAWAACRRAAGMSGIWQTSPKAATTASWALTMPLQRLIASFTVSAPDSSSRSACSSVVPNCSRASVSFCSAYLSWANRLAFRPTKFSTQAVTALWPQLPFSANLAVTIAAATVLGSLPWHWIEARALRYKNPAWLRGKPAAPPAAAIR